MTKTALTTQWPHGFLDLFNQIQEAALLVCKLEDGLPIVFASSGFYTMTGINHPHEQRSILPLIHPEDRDDFQEKQNNSHVQNGEFRLLRSSEEYRWVESKILAADHFEDYQGQVLICYLVDITEQKHIKEHLENQRKRLELVLEGTRLGLWDWNPQTNEVIFNERWASMLGYQYDEIEHTLDTWETKVHPDDLAACYEDITNHLEGRTDFYENVHRMKHNDGSWHFILDRGKIVDRDENGKPTRFTGTHTDITDQKIAELEAKQAGQAKIQFLANMSHEIRTPLHGMLGLLSLIKRDTLNQRDQKIFKTVQSSAKLLKEIINDILDFSKLDANAIQLDPKPTALTYLVQQSISLYQVMAKDKNLHITVNTDHLNHDVYYIDDIRLSQCINNLLSNAIKFTHQGSITVVLSNTDQGVVIAIQDTGVGIKDPKKVFDLFHQESGERMIQGTGLGLSITKQLAELMNGRVDLESETGKGSTFSLILPLEQAANAEYDSKIRTLLKPKPRKILVAEDNGINQLVITEMLQELGQSFTVTNNGEEALAALENESYDLLFLDLHMPLLNGHEVIEKLTKNNIDINIVLMSADAFHTNKSNKIVATLTKPFEKQRVHDVLIQLQAP